MRNESVDSEERFSLTRKTKLIGDHRSQQPAENVSFDMRSIHMLFSLDPMNIMCLPSELLAESSSYAPLSDLVRVRGALEIKIFQH